ncbi:glycosyltransferase family 2 protein [Candidatus Woesearchaeota archaeon]|nr:glycosyltransferase family 2 protein [Candidatus Woesearchaeota archaeon]
MVKWIIVDMFQYVVWAITFLTLWLVIVWLNFLIDVRPRPRLASLPKISFVSAAWNEQKTILRTIRSVLESDYPANLKEIIVVNDGSTDNTAKVVENFRKLHPEVVLINKVNGGKASAINEGIDKATGDIIAVLDADSRFSPDAPKLMVAHFANKTVGAVISRIRVDEPKNFLQKIQRYEYVMSSMTRFIMNNFGTLAITHGALSMFKTKTLRKLGGFVRDKENITEDFEIALRLKKNNFRVVMEPHAVSYTHVPATPYTIWRQRLRWSRGYIYNMWQYRSMIFDSSKGLFGTFQLPINVIAVALLILNVSLISYDTFGRAFDFVSRSLTIPDYFWNSVLSFPSLTQFLLARNIQIQLPLFISLVLGLYLVYTAHQVFKESLRQNILPFFVYLAIMPYFSAVNWIASISREVRRSKRSWR